MPLGDKNLLYKTVSWYEGNTPEYNKILILDKHRNKNFKLKRVNYIWEKEIQNKMSHHNDLRK